MVTFIIEGEPHGKGRHRTTRTGHTYTPPKTVAYENKVKGCYMERTSGEVLVGALKATIEAYYTIPKSKSKKVKEQMRRNILRPTKKPDADNVSKAVLDALNGLAYKDDSSVVELSINKYWADEGFVKVRLEELEPE
jgi:Holliday junction resolvase RusA-like endonuclease